MLNKKEQLIDGIQIKHLYLNNIHIMYLNDEGKHPNVDNNLCFSKLPLEVKQCHTKISVW